MTDNTVYDSAFKTMAHKAPKLMIPLINVAFKRDYPVDAEVVQFSNEHEGPAGSRITDSVFQIGDKIYHIECQSTADNKMVVRMMEYDFAIAIEGALAAGAPYEMDFPASCVLFLRHDSNTPDVLEMKVNLPDGDSFVYRVKVMKAQAVTSEEIFDKHLLILLPYYLMRYEKDLAEIEGDEAKTDALVAECARLRAKLEAATLGAGDGLLYEQLIELIIRVNDHLLAAHETLRKEVKGTMGGEVWELMGERAERLKNEAFDLGIKQGREQGIKQGREQGREQGIEQGRNATTSAMAEKLREQGVDESVIAAAVEAAIAASSLGAPESLSEA